MNHPQLIETRLATLERTGGRMVEVRIKPDVKLDAEGVGEIVRAKRELCVAQESDILMVVPPDVDFDLNVLALDHHALNGGCGLARRLAFAAQSAFNERLARIYFRYHPRDGETAVFVEEADARAWLTQSMPQPSLS
ncbi:MAG TPA: hypothetical protein PKY96_07060 [Flavobacteriales bacterium]|nr:hypothetical protein [Flavobacteriales bacterium]